MMLNEIWVIAEVRQGTLTRVTSQLLGAARQFAEEKNLGVTAVLVGGEEQNANELAQKVGQVLWLNGERLDVYESTRHLYAIGQLIESKGTPSMILAGASAAGMELLPRLAARCKGIYSNSCVAAWWDGDNLAVRRPLYGGRVYEELVLIQKPAVITVRPGVFSIPENLSSPGKIETTSISIPENMGLKLIDQKSTLSGKKDISEAIRVISGGRGMGSPENFKLIEDCAEVLDAAVGVSRAVVDSGWRPHSEQVGKSGKTISPELYIACGISGAIHHVLGMNTSKVVVAINNDPNALIFENVDFGLVGDAVEVVPALTEGLKALR